MKRRDFLTGLGAGTAGLTLGTADTAIAEERGRTVVVDKAEQYPDLERRPLVNTAQAQRVMEEFDLAGLIALNPVNVYYLTNTMPIGVKMRWQYPAFATYPRDPDQPTFLITTTAQLWDIANQDRWTPEVIPYTGPANWQDYLGEDALPPSVQPEAAKRGYAVTRDTPLGWREQAWADSQVNYQSAPTPEWAVARALKESGITRGRVAVDDMRIAALLEKIGVGDDISFVDGDNIFRHIRYIKSPVEIELMRIAAGKNYAAALATIRSLEAGMVFPDIERRFKTEAAARGNDVTFIIAGVTLGLLPEGEVRAGEPILVDAVSHFRQYHGDFARTVVVGEPNAEIMKRARAQQLAREATLELLKPGVRFSEIRATGFDAYKKAGADPNTLIVNPHSVGMQHTDHPYRDDTPFSVGADLELRAGMTITVDLPYIEVGFGAGHNEDLMLITDDGYELLHAAEGPLIIV